MVRALLDGRKTQTRRVLKPQPEPFDAMFSEDGRWWTGDAETGDVHQELRLPYAIGDRLWVREAWHTSRHYDDLKPSEMGGEEPVQFIADGAVYAHAGSVDDLSGRARPSMFMPRWASRLTLIVTDVRVQRMQEIDAKDACAEGALTLHPNGGLTPRDAFRDLWDSLNAPRGFGWDVNPWVAAYTFSVHRQNVDQLPAPLSAASQDDAPAGGHSASGVTT
ncbi:hypothetical protein [Mameliella alba]|uniref:hypothetical protein n=1 Tax=Mameliella alba TaxID=561184 RepID=UPI001668E0F8|nr:hypothetical protein [Mameliella alba]